jgi:hypothetical protein
MSTRNTRRADIAVEPDLSRYDLFLLLLPLPLCLGMLGAELTTVPLSTGVGMGGLPSLALLVYGLFVDGPTVPDTA